MSKWDKSNADKFKSTKLKFWGPPFPKSSFHPRSVVDSCVGNLNKRVLCVSDSCLKYKSKLANNRLNVRLWQFRIYAICDWPRPANILSGPRHLCTVWLCLKYQCHNKAIELWIRFHKYLRIASFLHCYTPLAVMVSIWWAARIPLLSEFESKYCQYWKHHKYIMWYWTPQ